MPSQTTHRRATAGLIAGMVLGTLCADADLGDIATPDLPGLCTGSWQPLSASGAVTWTRKLRTIASSATTLHASVADPIQHNEDSPKAADPNDNAASAAVDLSLLGVPAWLNATAQSDAAALRDADGFSAASEQTSSDDLPDSAEALAARYGKPTYTLTNALGGPYSGGAVLTAQATDVPEPEPLALLAVSLAGVIWRLRATATQPNTTEPNSQPAAGTGTGSSACPVNSTSPE